MLERLKQGFVMRRASWPAQMFLEKDEGQIFVVVGDPSRVTGQRELWRPENEDLLAVDWAVAESSP